MNKFALAISVPFILTISNLARNCSVVKLLNKYMENHMTKLVTVLRLYQIIFVN